MTLQYSNYKGETYYLHKRTGKKGGSQYSFSRREAGTPVKSIPEGYEIYEDPNGRVFLRKTVPTKISREELSAVENSIRQYAKIKDYKIDVKGKAITIFLPDLEIEELRACFDSFALVNHSVLDETLKTMLTYSPVLRFILADEKKREFRAERAGFADPDDEWLLLDGGNDLKKLAQKYCRHLGKDSFYDLL
ncbi:MAG: hypothetical protein ACXU9K_09995 [Thermodesulfobacteriota bacterium]